jgi:hypothetical protein
MAFKLLDMAQLRWRRLDGAYCRGSAPARSSSTESASIDPKILLNQGWRPDHDRPIHNI